MSIIGYKRTLCFSTLLFTFFFKFESISFKLFYTSKWNNLLQLQTQNQSLCCIEMLSASEMAELKSKASESLERPDAPAPP